MKRCIDAKGEYIKGETKLNDLFFFNKIALCHQSCYLIATPRIPYASFNHKYITNQSQLSKSSTPNMITHNNFLGVFAI